MTALSLDHLRSLGYLVDVVERWVPTGAGGARVRRDLFGILDLVAVREDGTLGVQTTTKGQTSTRARKIAKSAATPILLACGWRIVVHGWWQPNGFGTRWVLDEFDVAPPQQDGAA